MKFHLNRVPWNTVIFEVKNALETPVYWGTEYTICRVVVFFFNSLFMTEWSWTRWGAFLQPLLQWESNKYYIFSVCVCSLRYPAWNAHTPYWHPWPAPLYNIFPRDFINGTVLEKKLLNTKCVSRFSLQRLSETFFILRRTERDMIKNVCWSSCEVPLFLSDVNEPWIFSKVFRKMPN